MDIINEFQRLRLDDGIDERPATRSKNICLRTLELVALLIAATMFIGGGIIGPSIVVALAYYRCYCILAGYVVWYLLDTNTSSNGGRRMNFLRKLSIWRFYKSYFKLKIIKTAHLPPNQNFIIGYHPHGVISCGAFGVFATESCDFAILFPGILPHLMTLRVNFCWPFVRQFLMGLGMVDVSRSSIKNVCGGPGSGKAAVIVIGGASEALEAHPGKEKLIVGTRKGFVKEAIRNDASLVPTFAFGENSLFDQVTGPLIRKLQLLCKSKTGIAPIIMRGVANLPIPYPKNITVVVGKPIKVTKNDNPSQEEIDRVHGRYVNALINLYNKYKRQYSDHPYAELEI